MIQHERDLLSQGDKQVVFSGVFAVEFLQDSVDAFRGGRQWQMEVFPEHPWHERRRHAAPIRDRGSFGERVPGCLLQEFGVLAECMDSREDSLVGAEGLPPPGKQFIPNPISASHGLEIRGIQAPPFDAVGAEELLQLLLAALQQGPSQQHAIFQRAQGPQSHQSAGAAATQDPQEELLHHIAGVVRQKDHAAILAGEPRPHFQPEAPPRALQGLPCTPLPRHIQPEAPEGNPVFFAEFPAEPRVRQGVLSPELVVEMDGGDGPSALPERHQERQGVPSSGESHVAGPGSEGEGSDGLQGTHLCAECEEGPYALLDIHDLLPDLGELDLQGECVGGDAEIRRLGRERGHLAVHLLTQEIQLPAGLGLLQ